MMTVNDKSSYELRGTRVTPLSAKTLASLAEVFAEGMGLSKNHDSPRCISAVLEQVAGVALKDDKKWIGFTNGHYNPATHTITLPQKTLINASKKKLESLTIVLHEIGHAFLGHKALLHHSDTPPTMEEDSEWQADYFAEQVLLQMGVLKHPTLVQQSFPFYQQ